MKLFIAAACGLVMLSGAALAGNAEGTWLSQNGDTKVKLSDCGSKLCGTVVWLSEPVDRATGRPKTDKHNPDPAKRARPLIGLKSPVSPPAARTNGRAKSTTPTTATPIRRASRCRARALPRCKVAS